MTTFNFHFSSVAIINTRIFIRGKYIYSLLNILLLYLKKPVEENKYQHL